MASAAICSHNAARQCAARAALEPLLAAWVLQRSPFFTQLDGKVNVSHPEIQLVAVGLQEIEMGSSSVALAAAKDALATRMQAS